MCELQKRKFTFSGKDYPLSEKAIDNIIAEVCSPALNEGLGVANEKIYNHLLYGLSVTEFINGRKANPTIALIDWQTIDNNSYLFTEEMSVLRTNGVDHRRPDIVCFVNGIPFVVIEAKRPDGHAKKGPTIGEGVSQSLRNQRNDEMHTAKCCYRLMVQKVVMERKEHPLSFGRHGVMKILMMLSSMH